MQWFVEQIWKSLKPWAKEGQGAISRAQWATVARVLKLECGRKCQGTQLLQLQEGTQTLARHRTGSHSRFLSLCCSTMQMMGCPQAGSNELSLHCLGCFWSGSSIQWQQQKSNYCPWNITCSHTHACLLIASPPLTKLESRHLLPWFWPSFCIGVPGTDQTFSQHWLSEVMADNSLSRPSWCLHGANIIALLHQTEWNLFF